MQGTERTVCWLSQTCCLCRPAQPSWKRPATTFEVSGATSKAATSQRSPGPDFVELREQNIERIIFGSEIEL